MTRDEIINFCNVEIFPQVSIQASFFMNCFEVVDTVTKWIEAHDNTEELAAKVTDGFLYINDKPVERIAPKMNRKKFYDEGAYYIEGKILSRQEIY